MKADAPRSPLKILVAEDSPTQAERLRFILEDHGFQVITTRNGREALEALAVQVPTLVITDVNMPEIDGYELCRRIRADARYGSLPVILLTSLSDPEDVFRGLECGADNFITKPYEEGNLLARIHYLLANTHLRQREKMQVSIEVNFGGQMHVITSDRAQILNLLLSTYETAVQKASWRRRATTSRGSTSSSSRRWPSAPPRSRRKWPSASARRTKCASSTRNWSRAWRSGPGSSSSPTASWNPSPTPSRMICARRCATSSASPTSSAGQPGRGSTRPAGAISA
ncbi:MAG: response regulator [Verrucomicrobiota bacterium]